MISPVYGMVVIAVGVTMMLVGWHGAKGLQLAPAPALPWGSDWLPKGVAVQPQGSGVTWPPKGVGS